MEEFPTSGQYNKALHKKGSGVFRSLQNLEVVPSRSLPIKVYLFGSGAYAAVFKGIQYQNKYAIRCFLNSGGEAARRLEMITSYLQNIRGSWITSCEFLANEIEVDGKLYPVLKMEWVDGLLLNDFVSRHLSNNQVLCSLQKQLVEISQSLEENEVGHGDLQCGNIMVKGSAHALSVKLIDYDGMYTPYLKNQKSIENGRSEFQHPARSNTFFNETVDRFSIWVILTALEALKFDKSLWKEVMQGGFNTLDNMLFIGEDFKKPLSSSLFSRLFQLNQPSLNFYLHKIRTFCKVKVSDVEPPVLYSEGQESSHFQTTHSNYPKPPNDATSISDHFQIMTNEKAVVLTSTFKKLGNTPVKLAKDKYQGKTVVVSNGTKTRQILLSPHKDVIELTFT